MLKLEYEVPHLLLTNKINEQTKRKGRYSSKTVHLNEKKKKEKKSQSTEFPLFNAADRNKLIEINEKRIQRTTIECRESR